MSKTKELRKQITSLLNTVSGETYFQFAPEDAIYPYKVYDLHPVAIDKAKDNYDLVVDVWSLREGTDQIDIDDLCDEIEEIFNSVHIPNGNNHPTFFRLSRNPIDDSDHHLRRVQLSFEIQNYF